MALAHAALVGIVFLEVAKRRSDGIAVGGGAVEQIERVHAVVVVAPIVGQFLAVRTGLGIDLHVEHAVFVAADFENAVVEVMQWLAVGFALVWCRVRTGHVQFGQPVDHLARMVAQLEGASSRVGW